MNGATYCILMIVAFGSQHFEIKESWVVFTTVVIQEHLRTDLRTVLNTHQVLIIKEYESDGGEGKLIRCFSNK